MTTGGRCNLRAYFLIALIGILLFIGIRTLYLTIVMLVMLVYCLLELLRCDA